MEIHDHGCVITLLENDIGYIFPQYNFLFSEINHPCHGKPLYMKSDRLSNEFPKRTVHGLNVSEIKIRRIKNKTKVVTDEELISIATSLHPKSIRKSAHPFGENYVTVNKKNILKTVCPKKTFTQLLNTSTELASLRDHLCKEFEINEKDIGLCGSPLITGELSSNDKDIVIYCTPEKAKTLNNIISIIRNNKNSKAPAYGIDWPYRFKDNSHGIVDIFYAYKKREDCPISLTDEFNRKKLVSFELTIKSDLHGGFSPSLYSTTSQDYPWIIILGTAGRGIFPMNQKVSGYGTEIDVNIFGKKTSAIMIAYPFKQINGLKLK